MRKIAMALIGAVLAVTLAAPAQAGRPMAEYDRRDVCKNVKGVQTALALRTGYWTLDASTRRPNDCVAGWRWGR